MALKTDRFELQTSIKKPSFIIAKFFIKNNFLYFFKKVFNCTIFFSALSKCMNLISKLPKLLHPQKFWRNVKYLLKGCFIANFLIKLRTKERRIFFLKESKNVNRIIQWFNTINFCDLKINVPRTWKLVTSMFPVNFIYSVAPMKEWHVFSGHCTRILNSFGLTIFELIPPQFLSFLQILQKLIQWLTFFYYLVTAHC